MTTSLPGKYQERNIQHLCLCKATRGPARAMMPLSPQSQWPGAIMTPRTIIMMLKLTRIPTMREEERIEAARRKAPWIQRPRKKAPLVEDN